MQNVKLPFRLLLIPVLLLLLAVSAAQASTVLGPWVPIFKGIEHAVGTNTPANGGLPDLMVVHAVRVDLTDPDIQFFSTPRATNYVADQNETGGLTVSDFLTHYKVQLAINGNEFNPQTYIMPAWTDMDVTGLHISKGVVVSKQDSITDSSSILFTTNNQASIIPTNWPARSTAGIYTALSGTYDILANNVNIGSNYYALRNTIYLHGIQPRTAYGLSQDRRYFFILTIDGRQPGYSDGSYDWETTALLQKIGAWDGINMDGGGSTTLVIQDLTGKAVELNSSYSVVSEGAERTVGSHLGIFAKPVPGFVNDVNENPDDTAATITWTTIDPATTQVQYGLSLTNMTSFSSLMTGLVTNHAALLTGLTPGTGYYFQALATIGTNKYSSTNFYFVTTNYLNTNFVLQVTNLWRYTADDLDGVNWTAADYDDSGWTGPGPGLLWDDASGTPDTGGQPLNTPLPADPGTGFPYPTYYFRAYFTVTNTAPGTSLVFYDVVQDGAVFYLNGTEIQRLRMDPAPTPISNSSAATGAPCAGDPNCGESFVVSGDLATNLVAGDNVLAVEVHQIDQFSPTTFGTSLALTVPYILGPTLDLTSTNGMLVLDWTRGGFTLQQANTPAGPWINTPGPIITSPYAASASGSALFYRLIK